jgi:hypothetical protein
MNLLVATLCLGCCGGNCPAEPAALARPVYESWHDSAEGECALYAPTLEDAPVLDEPEEATRRRRLKGMSEGGGKLLHHSPAVSGKVAAPGAGKRVAPYTRSPRRLLYTLLNLRI